MTQQQLFHARARTLAERVRAWAERHDGTRFWQLTDALPGESASEVDAAAREVGALRWVEGTGFEVCRPRGGEGERR